MQIVGLTRLESFARHHPASRTPLNCWKKEVEVAHWRMPQDIKSRFPSASFLPRNRVIFNIKGNSYRLLVKVRFESGLVLVEWIGTHADYSKRCFS